MTDDDDKTQPTGVVFACTASDFHPYECDVNTCVHCNAVVNAKHNPETCAFCMEDNG